MTFALGFFLYKKNRKLLSFTIQNARKVSIFTLDIKIRFNRVVSF